MDFAEAETDNLLAVARDAHARQDYDITIAFAHALYDLFELRSRWDPWEQLTRLGLQAAEASGNRGAQAVMSSHLGTWLRYLSRWGEATDAFEQSLTIYREFGDGRGEGQTLNNLGIVYQQQGRWQEATDALKNSAEAFRDVGDHAAEERVRDALEAAETARSPRRRRWWRFGD